MQSKLVILLLGILLSLTLAGSLTVESRKRKEISCYPLAEVKFTTACCSLPVRHQKSEQPWPWRKLKICEVRRKSRVASETVKRSASRWEHWPSRSTVLCFTARGSQPTDSVPGSEGLRLTELCWLSDQSYMPDLTHWPLWRMQPKYNCCILLASFSNSLRFQQTLIGKKNRKTKTLGAFPQINLQLDVKSQEFPHPSRSENVIPFWFVAGLVDNVFTTIHQD